MYGSGYSPPPSIATLQGEINSCSWVGQNWCLFEEPFLSFRFWFLRYVGPEHPWFLTSFRLLLAIILPITQQTQLFESLNCAASGTSSNRLSSVASTAIVRCCSHCRNRTCDDWLFYSRANGILREGYRHASARRCCCLHKQALHNILGDMNLMHTRANSFLLAPRNLPFHRCHLRLLPRTHPRRIFKEVTPLRGGEDRVLGEMQHPLIAVIYLRILLQYLSAAEHEIVLRAQFPLLR